MQQLDQMINAKPEFTIITVMKEENLCLKALRSELEKLKSKNPSYSIRAFARDLEISHSFLNKVLNKKSSATPRLAYRLGQYTNRSESEILELIVSTINEADEE